MGQCDRLLDHIRRIALQGMSECRTDGQHLERFISERDEASFAALLRRHGAMVWSVCRRVLGNTHDADDAFQATFLVLVRKAGSVRPRESIGNWLYGVAYRTALEARRRIARRKAKEQSLQDVPPPESKPEEPWQELWPILDRELSRLADKYRLPIVLCDLEGRSRKEVARQLAIPEGTLSSRLATARKKLAARLARCGFAITAASLGTLLTEKTGMASLSFSLLSATTKAALLVAAGPMAAAGIVSATVSTLTEGVLKTMFLAKIKTATLLLCGVAALGVGTGGVYYQTRAGAADSPQADRVVQDNRKRTSEPREQEIDKLKRENEELSDMLARARNRDKVFQKDLITVVNNLTETMSRAHVAAQSDEPAPRPDPKTTLEELESTRQQINNEYNKQSRELVGKQKALQEKLQQLTNETQQKILHLEEMKAKIMAGQAANQQKKLPPGGIPKPASGDKLDQILKCLDRLEKRLDHLDKGKQP